MLMCVRPGSAREWESLRTGRHESTTEWVAGHTGRPFRVIILVFSFTSHFDKHFIHLNTPTAIFTWHKEIH